MSEPTPKQAPTPRERSVPTVDNYAEIGDGLEVNETVVGWKEEYEIEDEDGVLVDDSCSRSIAIQRAEKWAAENGRPCRVVRTVVDRIAVVRPVGTRGP